MTAKRRILAAIPMAVSALLGGCTGLPEGVNAISGFDIDRYLGTWYEIARLDHRFERGLSEVSAHYSLREDGRIRVVNRGYDAEEGEWKEAVGRARLAENDQTGRLEVSFFGPFYSAYNIIELDHARYRYAMVTGFNRSYLWILSREPELDAAIYERLVTRAGELGYATGELIRVEHGRVPES